MDKLHAPATERLTQTLKAIRQIIVIDRSARVRLARKQMIVELSRPAGPCLSVFKEDATGRGLPRPVSFDRSKAVAIASN